MGVEGRVDEVESEGPEQHARREEHGGKVEEGAANGSPCSDGRLGEGQANEEMRECGEPFGEGVKADQRQHHRRESKAKRVQFECAVCCCQRTDCENGPALRLRDQGVTVGSARIGFVELPVNEAIEAHANGARAHHAAEDPS